MLDDLISLTIQHQMLPPVPLVIKTYKGIIGYRQWLRQENVKPVSFVQDALHDLYECRLYSRDDGYSPRTYQYIKFYRERLPAAVKEVKVVLINTLEKDESGVMKCRLGCEDDFLAWVYEMEPEDYQIHYNRQIFKDNSLWKVIDYVGGDLERTAAINGKPIKTILVDNGDQLL